MGFGASTSGVAMREPVMMMASASSVSVLCASCAKAVVDSRARPRTAGAEAIFSNVCEENFFTIQSLALERNTSSEISDAQTAGATD